MSVRVHPYHPLAWTCAGTSFRYFLPPRRRRRRGAAAGTGAGTGSMRCEGLTVTWIPWLQGLTLVQVRAQLEQLQDTFMS